MFEVALKQKLSHLARKYSPGLVLKIWEEIRIAGGDEAYFSVCGWKTEMTLVEALSCLRDYCDFVEAMIRKHQEKEKRGRYYIPAHFN